MYNTCFSAIDQYNPVLSRQDEEDGDQENEVEDDEEDVGEDEEDGEGRCHRSGLSVSFLSVQYFALIQNWPTTWWPKCETAESTSD